MSAPHVARLAGLEAVGVRLWLKESGKLGYQAPADAEDLPELLSCLREWKDDLILELRQREESEASDREFWSSPEIVGALETGELDDGSPQLEFDEDSIDVPPDWRQWVARLPHDEWVEWRKRSGEIQRMLCRKPTVEDIQAADRQAYDETERSIEKRTYVENLRAQVMGDFDAEFGRLELAGWPDRAFAEKVRAWERGPDRSTRVFYPKLPQVDPVETANG